ncbi:uncharacterized protein GLRG_00446 [Colletotrichum graminicola M1.001]|uniref:Uncharacterized protein n=1 Tax=Colletotrichum graminicola (strain M1.001 / M2 / FGSC 10212) TaxID=645133 RepID=E3Q2K1_COLGM|nr:uncharacterized protein GLRG_00446 [Colletotrichum graminicola M1.001]EFQ25302.1 hypothetical protein GLRG_00446 [Colletotrichum graminicola M1.001]
MSTWVGLGMKGGLTITVLLLTTWFLLTMPTRRCCRLISLRRRRTRGRMRTSIYCSRWMLRITRGRRFSPYQGAVRNGMVHKTAGK